MLLPRKLKTGDTIGIVNPSQPLIDDRKYLLENFVGYIESLGLHVKFSKNMFGNEQYGTASGTPEQRAYDINAMFTDTTISGIWCGLGGDTANQTLDLIDYELIKRNPKILMGKSDCDTLLNVIHKKTGLTTFHCCDPEIGEGRELDFEYTKIAFKERLFEGLTELKPSGFERRTIRSGIADGKVIGCNIPSILKLAGTEYFPDFSNSIYFIETYKSSPSILIPQLTQLKHLGVFNKINGLIIGNDFGFNSDMVDAEQIITDFTKDYSFPILKVNEFGHYQPHAFLPIGRKVKLDSDKKTIRIIEDYIS